MKATTSATATTTATIVKKSFATTDLSKFQDMLHKGEVEFEFLKKDGTTRKAKGTLVASAIPVTATSGSGRPSSPNVCVYWDTEKSAFRSFVKTNFIGAY
jgi:hypothetical protein